MNQDSASASCQMLCISSLLILIWQFLTSGKPTRTGKTFDYLLPRILLYPLPDFRFRKAAALKAVDLHAVFQQNDGRHYFYAKAVCGYGRLIDVDFEEGNRLAVLASKVLQARFQQPALERRLGGDAVEGKGSLQEKKTLQLIRNVIPLCNTFDE